MVPILSATALQTLAVKALIAAVFTMKHFHSSCHQHEDFFGTFLKTGCRRTSHEPSTAVPKPPHLRVLAAFVPRYQLPHQSIIERWNTAHPLGLLQSHHSCQYLEFVPAAEVTPFNTFNNLSGKPLRVQRHSCA